MWFVLRMHTFSSSLVCCVWARQVVLVVLVCVFMFAHKRRLIRRELAAAERCWLVLVRQVQTAFLNGGRSMFACVCVCVLHLFPSCVRVVGCRVRSYRVLHQVHAHTRQFTVNTNTRTSTYPIHYQ